MLPLQQAREVTQSIREYIRATFAFSNEKTERAFHDFIEHPERGMIKGPYVSLRTPFLSADEKEDFWGEQCSPLTLADDDGDAT